MDPTVGIILFGGAVLATALVLISHTNGQAKIERQKRERAQLEAEADALERACAREDERHRRQKVRERLWEEDEYRRRAETIVAQEEEDRKKRAKRDRAEHHKTRNVLHQAAVKRKARRLYPTGVTK